MTVGITTAHRAARNAASIAHADAGAGNSTLRLYAAEGGALLGTRTLNKPCGTVNAAGRIALSATANDLVTETGSVTWLEWCDGNGTTILTGTVSDESGAGDFKLAGAAGTTIYQGGRVLLDDVILG